MDDPRSTTVPEERRRNEWWGIAVRFLAAGIILVGIYLALAWYLSDRVAAGTSVQGVDIGNLSADTASSTVTDQLAPLTDEPVTLRADDEAIELDPASAGLTVDVEATLAGTTGITFDPRELWAHVAGGDRELALVTHVDRDALQAAVDSLAQDFDVEPTEGQVVLSRGDVEVEQSRRGRALDVRATSDAVASGWPDDKDVTGVVAPVQPALAAEEIDRFVTEQAEPALDGPITVKATKGASMTISPNQISRIVSVTQAKDETPTLDLEVDEDAVLELVHGGLTEVEKPAQDARVRLGESGPPTVVDAVRGVEIKDASVVSGVRGVIEGDEQRTVTVKTSKVDPDISTKDADSWRVDAVMADFTSEFPTGSTNAERTENIRVGLRYVNGTVVMPGDQFSLSDTMAPITADRGYVKAPVIKDGRLVKGMGGGLSQVSTTVLNTAWSAGVKLDEFHTHSFYIPRYPVGREATIAVGVLDNRWTNDTPSPIVVETWIEGDVIQMRFWGDRQYTVDTVTGERRKVVQPERITDDAKACIDQAPQPGFDITVTRKLSKGGEQVRQDRYSTRYLPEDEVICTNPNAG